MNNQKSFICLLLLICMLKGQAMQLTSNESYTDECTSRAFTSGNLQDKPSPGNLVSDVSDSIDTCGGSTCMNFSHSFPVSDKVVASGSLIVGYEYYFNDIYTFVPLTPCVKYEMDDVAIPVPNITQVAKIGPDCLFSVAEGMVTMTNNADVSFLLRFRNGNWETSIPISYEYAESYSITKEPLPLQLRNSIILEKFASGDFQAVRIDIPSTGLYYLSANQKCEILIVDGNGGHIATIEAEDLLDLYSLNLVVGSYYCLILNTTIDEDSSEKQVEIRFMDTDKSVPRPEMTYEDETVTISCPQEDAVIYYTVDGTRPDATKTRYSGPFSLHHNAEVKAVAKAIGYADSYMVTLKVDSYQVEDPEIELQFDKLKIQITCATPDACIYYTMDGSDPSTNGQLYMEPIPMTSNCTVKAMAKRDGFHNSNLTQCILDVSNVKCGKPMILISDNLMTMSTATDGATIHYTLDGSIPDSNSTAYTSPILLEHNCICRAISVKSGKIDSGVAEATIDWFQAATPEFSYDDGVLTITCATPGHAIYYEIGGAEPTRESNLYSGPITLSDNRIVKAFAIAPGFNDSETVSYSPTSFTCAAPEMTFDGRAIGLSTDTRGASIFYTIDGTNPGEASESYKSKTILPGLCTVKAIAVMENMNNSPVTTYMLPCYYNGEEVYVKEPGYMAKAFEWCDGSTTEESLKVQGTLGDADFATIRNLRTLRHLDLSAVSTAKVPDEAFKDMRLLTVTMPECPFTSGMRLLAGCRDIAAVVWNSNTEIPLDLLGEMELPNLLLYVKYAAVANTKFGNIIVDGVASSITLSDAEYSNFHCPVEFTARRITYTHAYAQKSGFDRCTGWESIALPFSPTSISHETQGAMAPFAAGESGKKPFWLCELTSTGFMSSPSIKANKPYIIAMPNSDNYSDEYILAGNVTFSGNNVRVHASDDLEIATKGDNLFVPNFVMTPKEKSMALNVGESYNGHPEGSLFVLGLRDTHPFEAYVTSYSAARMFRISFDASDVFAIPENETVAVRTHEGTVTVTGLITGDTVDIHTMQGIPASRTTASGRVCDIKGVPGGPVVITVRRDGQTIHREKLLVK